MYMNDIYKKTFVFKANRYEEYQDGRCSRNGVINCIISAHEIVWNLYNVWSVSDYHTLESKVGGVEIDGGMSFSLSGTIPDGINPAFKLPLMRDDILSDRVQYGRLANRPWYDSNEPIVCNIFNSMECIRFAMTAPLRIIDFYGAFTSIS